MLFARSKSRRVTAAHIAVSGNGLNIGFAGDECKFSISSPGLLATHCSVGIEGPTKPSIRFSTETRGTIDCFWTPPIAGIYKIFVRYNNDQVRGSPFLCRIDNPPNQALLPRIRCSGEALKTGFLNIYNEVIIEEANPIIRGISISMDGPGQPEIRLLRNPQNHIVLYRCRVPGIYQLHIKHEGSHVSGSPFYIQVK
ncbi:Cheerio / Filamin-A/C -like protein [Dinothrombium tinctorium]|uniref:Cheerio / Filamin-A/C-like protein n=1 Tax=Dinothrombium tinctorium TaxID=1965070 RepID=A0A443QZG2_9ACAR|nr:Cheerio / Filamin-A/C -like protein [Dinothrombium tinctorium]